MASILRPVFISLLCGMAAIGHAAAWLHVGECKHENRPRTSYAAASASVESTHSDCCHHGSELHQHGVREVASEASEQPLNGNAPVHSHHGHDSDTCPICQSLAFSNGVSWNTESISFERTEFEFAPLPVIAEPESNSLSIPQPRGPPAQLA